MNKRLKEIVKQARLPACHLSHPVALERFAQLVRQDEREACAKLCDEIDTPDGWSTASLCASIRARENYEQN